MYNFYCFKHSKNNKRFKSDISFTNPETIKIIEFKTEENINEKNREDRKDKKRDKNN